jgi:hypothetical protein
MNGVLNMAPEGILWIYSEIISLGVASTLAACYRQRTFSFVTVLYATRKRTQRTVAKDSLRFD